MKPPFPSPTLTWHNDVYPAIDPTRSNLSCAGQTIIITGAGSGIGRETAIAFAAAGAKHVVLVGRTESTLTETQRQIPSGSSVCSVFACDVTDEAGMEKVAQAVGTWDVLILNAAYLSAPAPIVESPLDSYWKNYETNVKSIVIAAKVFIPTAHSTRAAVLAVNAGAICLPTKQVIGLSGYVCSKLAQIKTVEFLAAENPHLFFCSLHPGVIETKIFVAAGATPDTLPMDTAALPAHFMVWLSHPEAQFLNGKFVWANWDVDELKAKAQAIESSSQMTLGYEGWLFAPVG